MPPQRPSEMIVGLGISGGIAAYKAVEILRGLQQAGCRVRVAMTKHACEFVRPLTFRSLSGDAVIVDDYAPDNPDPIAHVTFSQSIDLLLVAPATANLLAKFAAGIADDFLTSTYLASTAPVLVAPAMNTTMWNHPATRRNLETLRRDGVRIIEPDAGEMACKTVGPGRLSAPERIVATALEMLRSGAGQSKPDLTGERVLVTAGATREDIDPVRFLSNRSSGRMGFAVAEAARARGAEVTLVAAATTVEPPADIRLLRAMTAEEMHAAVICEIAGMTVFVSAAAVSDYRPAERARGKIKKSEASLDLRLVPTPDILASVARSRPEGLIVVGFAAETENLVGNATQKMERKKLDLMVANDVSAAGAGFDVETNIVTLIARDRKEAVRLPIMSKLEAAHQILDEIVRLRRSAVRTNGGETAG